MTTAPRFLITCEHAGNRVPDEYRNLFRQNRSVLTTHRAFDLGARQLAQALAKHLVAPLISSTETRLLIDLNRSLTNRRVFSEYTRLLAAGERAELIARFYCPYRQLVEQQIEQLTSSARCIIHISVHTFVAQLNGSVRNADVGILYDPSRAPEKQWCCAWQSALSSRRPDLKIRRNYPYRGIDDGLTTFFRRRCEAATYFGIELEVNQRWPAAGGRTWSRLLSDISKSVPR